MVYHGLREKRRQYRRKKRAYALRDAVYRARPCETFYRGGIVRSPRNLHEIKSGRNIVRFLLFLDKFFDFQPQFIFVAKPCDFFHHFRFMMDVDCALVRPFIDKKNRFFVLLRKEVFVSEITLSFLTLSAIPDNSISFANLSPPRFCPYNTNSQQS